MIRKQPLTKRIAFLENQRKFFLAVNPLLYPTYKANKFEPTICRIEQELKRLYDGIHKRNL